MLISEQYIIQGFLVEIIVELHPQGKPCGFRLCAAYNFSNSYHAFFLSCHIILLYTRIIHVCSEELLYLNGKSEIRTHKAVCRSFDFQSNVPHQWESSLSKSLQSRVPLHWESRLSNFIKPKTKAPA